MRSDSDERGERGKKNLGPVPGHTAARSSTTWAAHSRCHAMVLDLSGGRPDAPPPPGGRRWSSGRGQPAASPPFPAPPPNMADGSRLRPPGEWGDSSAPSRTTATPPRPRSTAASLPSHLFFFCSSTTASGSPGGLATSCASPYTHPIPSALTGVFPGSPCQVDRSEEGGTGDIKHYKNKQLQKSGTPRTTAEQQQTNSSCPSSSCSSSLFSQSWTRYWWPGASLSFTATPPRSTFRPLQSYNYSLPIRP